MQLVFPAFNAQEEVHCVSPHRPGKKLETVWPFIGAFWSICYIGSRLLCPIDDSIRRCFAADAVAPCSCSVKGAKLKYLIFHLIAPASTPFLDDTSNLNEYQVVFIGNSVARQRLVEGNAVVSCDSILLFLESDSTAKLP